MKRNWERKKQKQNGKLLKRRKNYANSRKSKKERSERKSFSFYQKT